MHVHVHAHVHVHVLTLCSVLDVPRGDFRPTRSNLAFVPLTTRVRTDYLLCQVYYESLEKSMPLYNALGKLGL